MDGDVHDHHTLGTEMEGKNFESIGDEQTRETNVVEDAEEPNKGNLRVSGTGIGVHHPTLWLGRSRRSWDLRVFVDGTSDGPKNERTHHTGDGSQEEGTAAHLVDKKSSTDGETEIDNRLASGELESGQ